MGNIDASAVKGVVSIEEVIGSCIDLKRDGSEYRACCPFHKEKTPSFTVIPNDQFYYCFGCGANGDSIDFVRDFFNIGFKDACDYIAGNSVPDLQAIPREKIIDKSSVYDPYEPVQTKKTISLGDKINLCNPKRGGSIWKNAEPQMVTPYYNEDGSLLGYVLRFIIKGKKIDPAVRYCKKPDGSRGWTIYPFGESRPLYNLRKLQNRPDMQVLIVEGEKAAKVAEKYLGKVVTVTCWSGGSNSISKTDFSVLAGRNVVYALDRDDPGIIAARKLRNILSEVGVLSLKFSVPPAKYEKGWDIADREWKSDKELILWLKSHSGDIPDYYDNPDIAPAPEAPEPEEPPLEVYESEVIEEPPKEPESSMVEFGGHFYMLGYDNGNHFFLPKGSKQLTSKSAASLATVAGLISLAPLDYWEQIAGIMPGKDLKGGDVITIADQLIRKSEKIGHFDPDRIRGRGAWIDEGRNILHTGAKLFVDGVEMSTDSIKSKYLYPLSADIGINRLSPANNEEAFKLIEICRQLSWDMDLSAYLLAGWVAIAPICGVLDWRPHIWVTGKSGSGKSAVMKGVVKVVLGKMSLLYEGSTTEAGIRQTLSRDIIPVMIDEAETESANAAKNMQEVLAFSRICSTGGEIVKGTQSGASIKYKARTTFCFSSINISIKERADLARICVLTLKEDPSKPPEHWAALSLKIMNTITPEFSSKMLSRSIKYMHIVKENVDIFKRAAIRHFNDARIADQISPLLAGAYLCHSSKAIAEDEALKWIEDKNWSEHTVMDAMTDSEKLVNKICSHRIRINQALSTVDITIGEAIENVLNEQYSGGAKDSSDELKRHGILIDKTDSPNPYVLFANKNEGLERVLRNSPWSSSWARTISEIDGAKKFEPRRFSRGTSPVRSWGIPSSFFLN